MFYILRKDHNNFGWLAFIFISNFYLYYVITIMASLKKRSEIAMVINIS